VPVAAAQNQKTSPSKPLDPRVLRLTIIIGIAIIVVAVPDLRDMFVRQMADAYLQVTVFVAATLLLFHLVESYFAIDTGEVLRTNRNYQVPIAALLGALPGCGGAVVVMTQYVQGSISFGAVVAVLTSTMGDAAFLLLVKEPKTGLLVISISIIVGILSGYIVNWTHPKGFLEIERKQSKQDEECIPTPPIAIWKRAIWFGLLAPGFVLGLLIAFQVDTLGWIGTWFGYDGVLLVAAIAAFLAILFWASESSLLTFSQNHLIGGSRSTAVMADTNFITLWVVAGYVIYELAVHYAGLDIGSFFGTWAVFAPLIGTLVGFLPGCGPQIVMTTLYLNGVVPFSAQLANAISNDGDALFPAIAISPRAAIIATAYSAIPALIISYGYFFLFE
jgi:hypothetical protein